MKFTVSSSELLQLLSSVARVINSRNTLPILDYFLMRVEGDTLYVTASDLETSMVGKITLLDVEGNGIFAATSKLLLDVLKETPEKPITFDVNTSTYDIQVSWSTGHSTIIGASTESYPQLPAINPEAKVLDIDTDLLIDAVNKTIFATATDESRPIMTGIFFKMDSEKLICVATDAHKLVKISNPAQRDEVASFILPKKPALLLKNTLLKESGNVHISFDGKNAIFAMSNITIYCHLIEGTYPNYEAVIPKNNPNHLLVDRAEFLNGVKRVAVCASPGTNLITLSLENNKVVIAASDTNYAVDAQETLTCNYDGDAIYIGFKASQLTEILQNLDTPTIQMDLADNSRPVLFSPVYTEAQSTETTMLLMPMMIN